MDVEYPANLDQSDVVDGIELIPQPSDVATDYRACREFVHDLVLIHEDSVPRR